MRKRRQDIPTEIVITVEEEGVYSPLKAPAVVERAFVPDDDRNMDEEDEAVLRRVFAIACLLLLFLAALTCFSKTVIPEPRARYSCPKHPVTIAANDIPLENAEYERVTNQIKTNMTHYMKTFQNSSFDAWGRTYERVKEGMYHWKSTRFAPFLENGDSIYESACGIGMNLYMTLEILNEVKGLESLVVYGNEYVSVSAEVANVVFDPKNAPFKAVKGTICPGDSANINFVPSNSFDLVYTGYIT